MEGAPLVLTYLFTDVEGSTRLVTELGAERYARAQEVYRRLVRDAVREAGGEEVRTQGDALFFAFERPGPAVAAALGAQLALGAEAWDGAAVRSRIGIHTGQAVRIGDDYAGLAVNQAARICEAGHGGQVLLSETTKALVDGDLPSGSSVRDLGPHRLKDLAGPQRLFQLLHAGLEADLPPLRALDLVSNNLPIQLTSFVGRAHELEAIRAALKRSRLVTLTGPGGAGKTRLALQAAAELIDTFADGVWFVDLATSSDDASVARAVADAVRVREETGAELADTIAEALRDRVLLVVLDNCEHVVAAAATLADALLKRSRGLHVIATSREALRVDGEVEWRVPPLSVASDHGTPDELAHADAVRLFLDRSRSGGADVDARGDLAAVARICRRLDGIPLAIELAAARTSVLSPAQIAARLDDRFGLLRSGSRTAEPRHRSLSALLDWSWELLDAAERQLLARLSVFRGEFDLAAVESICGEDDDVLDVLSSLVEKSLIAVEPRPDEAAYRLLETIRDYAAERLDGADGTRTRQRFVSHYARLADQARPHLTGRDRKDWFDRLERDHDNLRAALAYAAPSDALAIAADVSRFWLGRGFVREGRERLHAALEAAPGADSGLRSRALTNLTALAVTQGDLDLGRRCAEQALALRTEAGDRRGIGACHNALGNIARTAGDLDAASDAYRRSLEIAEEIGDAGDRAAVLNNLGNVEMERDDPVAAGAFYERALALWRDAGDRWGSASALSNLGLVAFELDQHELSRDRYAESLAIRRELGDRFGIALSLGNAGNAALRDGRFAEARSALSECAEILQDLGDDGKAAEAFAKLALAHVGLGEEHDALAHSATALQLCNRGRTSGDVLRSAAHVLGARGRLDVAVLLLARTSHHRRDAGVTDAERGLDDELLARAKLALDDSVYDERWRLGAEQSSSDAHFAATEAIAAERRAASDGQEPARAGGNTTRPV